MVNTVDDEETGYTEPEESQSSQPPAENTEEIKEETIDTEPVTEDLKEELKSAVKEEQETQTERNEPETEEELPDIEELKSKKEPVKEETFKMPPLLKNMALPGFKIPKIKFKEIPGKIAYALREYKRIIIISKKPDTEELAKISKIAGLGIILIGLIGFVIQIIFQLAGGFK